MAEAAWMDRENEAAITYAFAGVVYVSLTNRSNARLTMLEANGPGFEFPPGTGFAPLPQGYEPTAAKAAAAALGACDRLDEADGTSVVREVVYAGLGEPLLRLQPLCETVEILAASDRVGSQRLNTNGLIDKSEAAEAAQKLASAGLSSACVQIQSGDGLQHAELMTGLGEGWHSLCDATYFATELLRAGVVVQCSVVARPEVDLEKAEALALKLGATFKVRSYFP